MSGSRRFLGNGGAGDFYYIPSSLMLRAHDVLSLMAAHNVFGSFYIFASIFLNKTIFLNSWNCCSNCVALPCWQCDNRYHSCPRRGYELGLCKVSWPAMVRIFSSFVLTVALLSSTKSCRAVVISKQWHPTIAISSRSCSRPQLFCLQHDFTEISLVPRLCCSKQYATNS